MSLPEMPGYEFEPAGAHGLIPLRSQHDRPAIRYLPYGGYEIIGVWHWVGEGTPHE